ncbi:MAG: 1-acyl-sn-glycerol-3-phosphate acyltransferase [Butyrivibrio sp.]|jgi:1-acyl-sn-glycerol-3-phosphate acyltransferase|uniref:lysophospholipid acyltransferase family protein n=1 Tax=Butyrivibrio sp. TaxID=28121 RepID=UPI001ECEA899|nr:lysophospholipid acyltransferase family protein [Butyrivibrio sp.]MBE5841995.1 1-acyl-sn-glycerol-3-phosphate acyltransferase [Butyrivibrio sp.]
MRNFYHTILINLHRIIYYVVKTRIWMKHPERHSEEERYGMANEMIYYMNKSSGYETEAFGTENLPAEGGYMLYPNHQGKYDVPGIFATHKKPCSFVMDEKRSHLVLVSEVMWMVDGKRLELDNPRQTITVFREMAEELKAGRKFILFPEGGYKENNGNVVEPFKAGSFKLAQMAKVPIVPVALVDSYKVFNSDHVGPVKTYVYYLEPIPYEEYKGLKSIEIAQLVEDRIKAKIAEHLASRKAEEVLV